VCDRKRERERERERERCKKISSFSITVIGWMVDFGERKKYLFDES